MAIVENEPRTGVWIEKGKVYRSDIGELPRIYIPGNGLSPEELAELVRQVQEISCAEKQDLELLDEKITELRKLTVL